MGDQPLQLLEFTQEDDGGNKELLLNHENLNSVLEQAKDRPIAVISICGPTRQGKSLFLGYLVRYLEAVENDEDDGWMNWDNKTKPLNAFNFKGGVTPVTQGIWIWSRPFFITNDEGIEIAVVLIDTQGTNSEYTTTRDMSVIAGLSLLTSSVVIFNFFTNIQEDVLAALNTYTQFGTLAMDKSNGNETPFQKLIFLIRDWNNPGEFPYGAKGGKSFLQEKLQVKDGNSADAKQVRETIRKCFEKLDCYLMPPIGDKALGPDFTGSVAELNRSFALKLEDFINTMLNGLTLPIKKVLGNEITASELTPYLEKYVAIFNSDQVPTSETMWLATSQMANNNIIEKSLKSYRECMQKRIPKGKKYIPKENLTRFHTAGERQALLVFKKALVVGSPEATKELREELRTKLKSQFSEFIQLNEDKRKQFVAAATNDANTSFREQLETVIQLEDADDTKFYEETLIIKTTKDVQADILDDFYEKFPNEDEDDLNAIVQSLESSFESILQSFITKNKNNRANAEQTMNNIVDDLHSSFQVKVQEFFATNEFEDNDAKLDQTCQDFKAAKSASFQQARKPGKREFYGEYLTRLEQEMDSTFSHLRNQHKLRIRTLVQEAETFSETNVTQYEVELRGVAQGGGMNEAALRMIHSMKASNILDKFYRDNPFPRGSNTSSELETKLKNSLQQVVDNVINEEVKLKKEQSEKSYESARLHCLDYYDQEMKKLHETDDFILDEKLEREHNRIRQEALRQYEEYPKIGTSEREQEIKSEIKSSISSKFETIKNRNEQSRRLAESVARKAVQTCEDKYDQIMQTEFDTFRDEGELKAHHGKAKATAFSQLQVICSGWDVGFGQQYLEALKYDIDEKYEELKGILRIRIGEEVHQLGKLLDDAKTHYNEEMKKHFQNNLFMNPANVLNTHQQVKDAVIMKLDRTTGITPFLREGLAKELDELLTKYKEKNYMNASSELGLGMAPAIGIDLGTTFCCVAVYFGGRVHIIPNQQQGGDLTTPSYVTYDPVDGSETYGHASKNNAYRCPDNTIYDAKRIIGRNMTDPELQNDMKFWPFTVQADENGIPKVMVNGTLIFPEQVSAKLLTEFRKMAENFLNLAPGTIKKAVITVPAYFNDGQRQATVDAGELAGLEVLTILNEPTAAAISYSMERLDTRARKIVVYDLGGGTFDVVILDMKAKDIDVLGVNGDTHLGGEDFDKKMMTYCAAVFKTETGIDLFADKDSSMRHKREQARRRLRRLQTYCENAKLELSTGTRARVSVDSLAEGQDLTVEITRAKFDELNMAYFRKTIALLDETLKEVGLRKQDIDDVVLVGGSSRILKVQEMLTEYFEGKALNKSIHPDHAVAYGAAVKAAMLNGEQAKGKLDVGQIQDVTPFSLGTEIVTQELSVIIPKNSKIPIKKMKLYSTVADNQTTIEFKIYQGEDLRRASNNKLLGVFEVSGIPPSLKGTERIEVSMTVNSVGILHVEGVCRSTKAVSSLTVVENKSRMSTETKRRLMSQARTS